MKCVSYTSHFASFTSHIPWKLRSSSWHPSHQLLPSSAILGIRLDSNDTSVHPNQSCQYKVFGRPHYSFHGLSPVSCSSPAHSLPSVVVWWGRGREGEGGGEKDNMQSTSNRSSCLVLFSSVKTVILGVIQVLRNADGGGQIFRKKALRRCNVQRY